MKRITAALSVVALTALCGCSSAIKQFPKVVEAAGTANKEIDLEADGWNTHIKYHSKPIDWRPPMTNANSFTVTPETTLRVEKNK